MYIIQMNLRFLNMDGFTKKWYDVYFFLNYNKACTYLTKIKENHNDKDIAWRIVNHLVNG